MIAHQKIFVKYSYLATLLPSGPHPSGGVKILVRKDVGNPTDFFNKNFNDYKRGFSADGVEEKRKIQL